jgi:hypothetical protein
MFMATDVNDHVLIATDIKSSWQRKKIYIFLYLR